MAHRCVRKTFALSTGSARTPSHGADCVHPLLILCINPKHGTARLCVALRRRHVAQAAGRVAAGQRGAQHWTRAVAAAALLQYLPRERIFRGLGWETYV